MDETALFDAWGRRVHHARVQAILNNPYARIGHVFVGREVERMCKRQVTPPPDVTQWVSPNGTIGIPGGLDIILDEDLQPDAWQLRGQSGIVVAHGRLTDLEPA